MWVLKLATAAAAALVLVLMRDEPLEWGVTRFRRELRTFLATPTRSSALVEVGQPVQWSTMASAAPAVAARLEGHLEAWGGEAATAEVVFVFLRHIVRISTRRSPGTRIFGISNSLADLAR